MGRGFVFLWGFGLLFGCDFFFFNCGFHDDVSEQCTGLKIKSEQKQIKNFVKADHYQDNSILTTTTKKMECNDGTLAF